MIKDIVEYKPGLSVYIQVVNLFFFLLLMVYAESQEKVYLETRHSKSLIHRFKSATLGSRYVMFVHVSLHVCVTS